MVHPGLVVVFDRSPEVRSGLPESNRTWAESKEATSYVRKLVCLKVLCGHHFEWLNGWYSILQIPTVLLCPFRLKNQFQREIACHPLAEAIEQRRLEQREVAAGNPVAETVKTETDCSYQLDGLLDTTTPTSHLDLYP